MRTALAASLSATAPSMGFCAPTAPVSLRGSVHAGFACPPPSVPRVWLPSQRLTPSRASSNAEAIDSATGVFPSELSPHRRLPGLSALACPACHSSSGFASTNLWIHRSWSLKIGFRVRPGMSPLLADRRTNPSTAGCSPGLFPFRGSCFVALNRRSRQSPLTRLDIRASYPAKSPVATESRSATTFFVSVSRRPLLGFLRHSIPGIQFVHRSGLSFPLAGRSLVTAETRPALWTDVEPT